MARIFETEGGYAFDADDIQIPLNETNFIGYLHREAASQLMDMVGIQDPRDEMFWTWFRYNQDPETFDQMMGIAQTVGTVILRSTPLQETEQKFYNRFSFDDNDFDALLGGSDE